MSINNVNVNNNEYVITIGLEKNFSLEMERQLAMEEKKNIIINNELIFIVNQ